LKNQSKINDYLEQAKLKVEKWLVRNITDSFSFVESIRAAVVTEVVFR